jgi:hypothetical protein
MANDRMNSFSRKRAALAAGRLAKDVAQWHWHGWMANIGTKVGREYTYSVNDVCAHIAPMAFLASYGLSLQRAHDVTRNYADAIKAALRDSQGRDLCIALSLRPAVPGLDGAADSDGPEALLHVNLSRIAQFALARLQECEKPSGPRRRRSPLPSSIASEFVGR